MIQPITEREWVGLTLEEANNKATIIGYITRIVEQDGISLMLPNDVKSNRVNLRIKKDKVIGVYTG